jgi:hypothetical protein
VSDYKLRAVFLDQVEVGQRIRLDYQDSEQASWTVTEKRVVSEESILGGTRVTVHLLGAEDNGAPRFLSAPGWTAVVVFVTAEDGGS